MNRMRRIGWFAGIVAPALLIVFSAVDARADVTIKRTSTFKGMGGMLNSESTSQEMYAGDMSATDTETRMTNKVIGFFGGGKPTRTTSITRLDKGLIWDINHQEKTYTEMTLAELRAFMESLGQTSGTGSQETKPAIDTSEYTFSPPKFEVKKTGKKAVIAGQDCDESVLTMTTVGTNKKTGEQMTLAVTMSMMLAQNVPGMEEQEHFAQQMIEALGYTADRGAAESMAGMLKAYGLDPEELAAEAEKMKGFAMRTDMTFRMEIPGTKPSSTAQPETTQAEPAAGGESEEQAKSSTPSSAQGAASKALGGLFGKKKDKDKDKGKTQGTSETASEPQPGGPSFTLTTIVTEISTAAVAPERFEVPTKYKKEESPLLKK